MPEMRNRAYNAARKLVAHGAAGGRRVVERTMGPVPDSRVIYDSMARLSDRHGYPGLTSKELRVFSQNGEDGVIAEILALVGVGRQFFVEFGVEDGVECNTRFLAEVLGWSGIYFEPHPENHRALRRRYSFNDQVATHCEFVTADNARELFERVGVPKDLDLLSIDIDGQDYWVWEALSDYRPRLVVIEYNSSLSFDAQLVEPRGKPYAFDGYDDYGASAGALMALGRRLGYTLVHTEMAGVNAFFVRDDLVGKLGDVRVPRRAGNIALRGWRHRPVEGAVFVDVSAV